MNIISNVTHTSLQIVVKSDTQAHAVCGQNSTIYFFKGILLCLF